MEITWFKHASFKLFMKNRRIFIDPYQIEDKDKADLILISHGHYDHFSRETFEMLRLDHTQFVTSTIVAGEIHEAIGLAPGEIKQVEGITIEAVHAYNIGKPYHPKGEGIGFMIEAENKRVYFAGDTDQIPEMDTIKADIALVPVGGTYTMTARVAAAAVIAMKPKIAIPMHYGAGIVGSIEDADVFKEIVEAGSETKVMVLREGETIKV